MTNPTIVNLTMVGRRRRWNVVNVAESMLFVAIVDDGNNCRTSPVIVLFGNSKTTPIDIKIYITDVPINPKDDATIISLGCFIDDLKL